MQTVRTGSTLLGEGEEMTVQISSPHKMPLSDFDSLTVDSDPTPVSQLDFTGVMPALCCRESRIRLIKCKLPESTVPAQHF